ncbi:hypothetical protein Tco_1031632 [Tanacetum coccineum]|uniref:Uncharacterized protein n=1 Tax=Tanacetum coccineum TaxID=301880 RepID=A0ABQ5G9I9_9ASTR
MPLVKPRLTDMRPTHYTPALDLIDLPLDNLNTGFEEVTPGNIEAISPSADHEEEVFSDADDDEMPEIRIYDKSSEGIFEKASYDDDGIITDFNNLPDEVDVSTNHTLRIHNAHPQSQILGDPNTPVQTRSSLKKITEAHALVSYIQAQQRSNHKDQQHCLFACFLSQSEPRKVSEALEDESWVEAMQEELLQFKLQQVWVLVDLPNGAKTPQESVKVVKAFVMGLISSSSPCYSNGNKGPVAQDEGSNPKGVPSLVQSEDFQVHQGKTKARLMESQQLVAANFLEEVNLMAVQKADNSVPTSTTKKQVLACCKLLGQAQLDMKKDIASLSLCKLDQIGCKTMTSTSAAPTPTQPKQHLHRPQEREKREETEDGRRCRVVQIKIFLPQTDQGHKFALLNKKQGFSGGLKQTKSPSTLEAAAPILTYCSFCIVFKGSQAPLERSPRGEKGKAPMTEEDLQAESSSIKENQDSKSSRANDLEPLKDCKLQWMPEAQGQIHH